MFCLYYRDLFESKWVGGWGLGGGVGGSKKLLLGQLKKNWSLGIAKHKCMGFPPTKHSSEKRIIVLTVV